MADNRLYIILTIGLYLIGMLLIGVHYSKKTSNSSDFYLGGRTLGPLVTAMSAEASDMSSWLLMGLPGLAYLTGVANAAWTGIGLAIGTYVNWLIVAKRIRTYSHHLNAITIPDFFSKRYHDDRNIINFVSAVIIIIFFIPYTASGFAACGKLFASLFGLDYFVAMIVSAAVIVGYTALGGFLAASTTDLVQSIIMTMALVVIMTFGISKAGGLGAVIENANSLSGYFSLVKTHVPETAEMGNYNLFSTVSTLAWGLGYFGMPHILLRFMAIQDKQKLSLSRRIATIWVLISLTVAIFIGIVGNAMTSNGAIDILEGSKSETVIIAIATLLSSHGILPALIAGLILAGILAATMSTADSQLLAASSSISQNIFQDFFKIEMDERKSMLVSRLTVVFISIIGVIIAYNPNSSVFDIVSFAWAGFGATFAPVVLCALFWRRSNKIGVLAGMFVGAVTIFVWKYAIRPMGGLWDVYELLPAFVLALLTIICVSLMTSRPSKEIQDEFDDYVINIHE